MGTLDRPHRLSARLPRLLHARRHGRERARRQDRRRRRQPRHAQLHLREGAALRRARLRRGPAALPGGPQGRRRARASSRGSRGTRRSTRSRARMPEIRDTTGAEAILPFCYGGSNGLLTQDTNDAELFRALRHVAPGARRSAPRRPAPPTWRSTARCRASPTPDYVHARLIVLWGVNPSASGIHLVPFVQGGADGRRHARRDRSAGDGARASRPTCTWPPRPGTDLPIALALHRVLFEEGHADRAFPRRAHATAPIELRARARRMDDRARGRGRRHRSRGARAGSRELYVAASPALVRCGWGLERNRNGGSAAAAVLALPAVGGKFGVRGGGFSMSNSAAPSASRRRRG